MPVTVGLMDRAEQTMAGRANKTAGAGRGEGVAKKPEEREFLTLFKNAIETPEDEEEKNPPEINDQNRAQLLLLFPQLASISIAGNTSTGEGEEVLAAVDQSLTGVTGLTAEGEATPSLAEAWGDLPQAVASLATAEDVGGMVEGTSATVIPESFGQLDDDAALAMVDGPGADGSLPGVADGMALEERSKELLSIHGDKTEETQTSPGVNWEKAGQYHQPSFTADEGHSFSEVISDEMQAQLAAKTVATDDKAGATQASGESQPDPAGVGETPKSTTRPGNEVEPVFQPVDGTSPAVWSAEEIADASPNRTETREIGREELTAQIIGKAKLMVKNGMTKVQIQLEPAELGKLELSLVVERDLVAARFVTATQSVQALIEANLPQLRSSLEEAGLRVDLLQVGVQTGTDPQGQNEAAAGGYQFKRNSGWTPSAESYYAEEAIFADEAWHGMVNLRV